MSQSKYKRVLIKISGGALAKENGFGINDDILKKISDEILKLTKEDIEVGIVVGGGNFWRGRSSKDMDRSTADYMGMLATSINALALQDYIENSVSLSTRVMSAIDMKEIAEPYIKRRADRHLEKGRIVIFAAGTGNPYFTTDTAAALRAAEINADVILLAKNIDGVYDRDPEKYDNAQKYDIISYKEIVNQELGVMDATAVTMCKENNIPILVFDLKISGSIYKSCFGQEVGTIIKED
ncbi:MAG: UMP kinase [Bacillota bacterium]